MTLKDKMRTYNFWISLVSAVLLLVRIIGDNYGFDVDAGLVMDITTGVCGIFVILGIISVPQKVDVNKLLVKGEDRAVMLDNKANSYNDMFVKMNENLQKAGEKVENTTEILQESNVLIENMNDFASVDDNQECDEKIAIIVEDEDIVVDSIEKTDETDIENINHNVEKNSKLNEFISALSDEERENLKTLL